MSQRPRVSARTAVARRPGPVCVTRSSARAGAQEDERGRPGSPYFTLYLTSTPGDAHSIAILIHTTGQTPALPRVCALDASMEDICYAMLCYAMLCYAMLCYAMLCYAMLCYAMLCYAMLRGRPTPAAAADTYPDQGWQIYRTRWPPW